MSKERKRFWVWWLLSFGTTITSMGFDLTIPACIALLSTWAATMYGMCLDAEDMYRL